MRLLNLFFVSVGLLVYGAPGLGEQIQIRGDVVDPSGAAVGGAKIRLLSEGSRVTLRRCQADRDGRFNLENVPAGRYLVAASAIGFREKLVPAGSAQGGIDDVSIRLEVLGCDAPGVNCDMICTGSCSDPRPVRSKGYLTIRRSGAVNLDKGALIESGSLSVADLSLEPGPESGLYLRPLNRARIAQLGKADSECAHAIYQRDPVRIDGLGPGSDVCLRTNSGAGSQIFITGEVQSSSEELRIYFVTRAR
jgi:hypothetical protein